jgi:hypothetical protein
MSSSTDNRAEITVQQASELVARARAAAQVDSAPEEVAAIRDSIELRIVTCNRWVSMLLEWVRRGLIIEAASVDESYPELCKCAHVLVMPEDRLSWDQACNRAGIPLNARIDEGAYVELSDAIGDAASLDEFAQRFQLAVLGRKPLAKRMKALQELLAAAPRNESIRKLAKRYEGEALASLEASCRAAAAEGRHEELDDALDAIEGLRWESHFSSQFMDWIRAEHARRNVAAAAAKFEALAPRVEAAFAARDLLLLGALLEETEAVEQAHRVEQGDGFRSRTREAFAWAEGERERLRIEAEHAEGCESMRRALDQGFSYPELEPIRGRILSHGIGVPEDIEARFETAAAAWRSSRRRKAATVIGAAALAVASVVGVILYLSHEQAERVRAVELGTRIGKLADDGQFAEAKLLLDSSLGADPWMREIAEVDVAAKRVADEHPKYDRRRADVRALLAPLAEEQQADEQKLVDRVASLMQALERTSVLERLTTDEAADAANQVERLQEKLAKLRTDRQRRVSEEFDQLRRDAAALKSEPDRSAQERGSADATKAYMAKVTELDTKLEGFLARAPADLPERPEAQRIRDRLSKDLSACSALLPRLEEAAKLLSRLQVKPNSEEEYAELVGQLADRFGDLAANADPRMKDGLPKVVIVLRGAKAIEHWRSQVIPQIKAADASADAKGTIKISSRREQAVQIDPVLNEHLQSFPDSPYRDVAMQWLGLCRIAAGSPGESAGAAAIEAVQQLGILDLVRVPLREGRYAFCRKDAAGDHALRGLLNERADLLVGPNQLRANIELNTQHKGVREPTTWSKQLTEARDRLLTAPMVDVRGEWLRMLARIKSSSPPEEWVATGPVILELMTIYADILADSEGADKSLCDQIKRLRGKYQSIDACNWPSLAIKPPKDTKRQIMANDVKTGLFPELPKFDELADQQAEAWRTSVEQAKPMTITGVLLPAKAGEAFRRVSPAELTGEYQALCRDEQSKRLVLRDIFLKDGKLEGPVEGAPLYTLIFMRTSR